jgi:serine/threonine protein kinase
MTQPNDRQQTVQIDQESPLVDQVLDEVLQSVRGGQELILETYYQRYPDLADELRLLLPAMVLMECPKSPLKDSVSQRQPGELSPLRLIEPRMGTPPVLTDYAVVSEIGRGAMGVVYEAIQLPLKRRVALKVLFHAVQTDEKFYPRFLREAEIAARLHHTNIVPVFEFGESEGCYYYAMQLIEGYNLLQWIEAANDKHIDQRDKPTLNSLRSLDDTFTQSGGSSIEVGPVQSGSKEVLNLLTIICLPETCAKIVYQVADGLYFAHQRGILHRDIKPSNIIIDREQRAWIADFGLAKADDDTVLTDANDVVGTVRYLAPERFQGRCDARSDIYALGVTLYEVLHRRPFWPASDRAQLVQQIVNGHHAAVSKRPYDCPRDLRQIVEKATQSEPAQRYQTAGEMAEDLRRFLDGRPVLARQPSMLRRSYLWARRNKVVSSLLGLLLLLGSVSAIVTGSLSYRAETLRVESLKNFENAKRNLGFLLETVDKVCMSLSQDQRLNRPEFQELRHQLLQMVIDFNHEFDGVPEIAIETRYLSAKAHVRLGSLTSGNDTLAESAEYLESARAILTELHQTVPNRDEFSLELARCLREMASVEWKMGIRESALERNELAIRLCDQLRDSEGLGNEASIELARNQLALGGFLSEAGSTDAAEGHFLAAIEVLAAMDRSHANHHSYSVELGNAFLQLGNHYLTGLKHWRKAGEPLEKAAELYQAANVQEPGNPDLAAAQARVLFFQAKHAFIANNRADAVEKIDSACNLLSDLVRTHGHVATYRALNANSLQRLAEYRISLDRENPEIFRHLEKAVAEYKWLIVYDPNNISYKKGLISTLTNQAEFLTKQGRWQPASSCLDSAMSIVDELEFLEGMDQFVRELKHFILCRQAELSANLDRFEESLARWDLAISLASNAFRDINRIQRLRTVVLSGDSTGGVAELERLLAAVDDQTKGRQHYWGSAARVFALAHQRVVQSPNSGNLEELAEGYARRALQMMAGLLDMEMFNLEFTESSPDYNSLRQRADFKAILEEARRKSSITKRPAN